MKHKDYTQHLTEVSKGKQSSFGKYLEAKLNELEACTLIKAQEVGHCERLLDSGIKGQEQYELMKQLEQAKRELRDLMTSMETTTSDFLIATKTHASYTKPSID
jgi:hypothetical protein